ncbi:hypothetical protein MSKU15_0659 [Komagataeibacter diospyri]|nr:hypothetical protein MSKU15_0659 [Komagataeibacter diospyri]
MRLYTLAILVCLSSCSSAEKHAPEAVLESVQEKEPIAVSCVPADLAPAPSYPDSNSALQYATGPAQRYALLYAGRKLRDARLHELEPIVAGCSRSP